MKIQIVGPVCGTGYGLTVAHLTYQLSCIFPGQVQLLCMGDPDMSRLPSAVAECCRKAIVKPEEGRPDFTLCIWHEWDHPPKQFASVRQWMAEKYLALPTFELDRVRPEAVEALKKCHEVIVSSSWCQQVLALQGVEYNVSRIPHHGVDEAVFQPGNIEAITKPHGPFRMFNMGKLELRKGHDLCLDLVAAMTKLGIDVQLWAMWDNPFMDVNSMRWLLAKWAQRSARQFGVDYHELYSKVLIVSGRSEAEDVAKVINATVAGVYPFRAEGWNLPLLETMACARPVIATFATAPVDYLTETNSYRLEKNTIVPADDGIWFGEGRQEGMWYEPNFEELLQAACKVQDLWSKGKLEPNWEGRKTALTYTWKAAAQRLASWLQLEFGSSS